LENEKYEKKEIIKIAGVGQFVKIDDLPIRVGLQGVTDEVAADETGTARDEISRHLAPCPAGLGCWIIEKMSPKLLRSTTA
jgi:hypothetical protein